jgi:hypothetical protein
MSRSAWLSLDADFRPFAAVGDARLGMDDVIGDEPRIVDLQQKTGVDDRPVFLAHGVGDGEDVFLRRLVVDVPLPVLDVGRGNRRHERLCGFHVAERGFEIVDVALELGVALIGDRPGADHVGVARSDMGLRIKFRKRQPLARAGPLIARAGHGVDLVTAEPFVDVADEARLAEFAVVDHVDAEFGLLAHDVGDGGAQPRGGCRRIESLGAVALHQREQIGRPRQAAGVGRKNSVAAAFHGFTRTL